MFSLTRVIFSLTRVLFSLTRVIFSLTRVMFSLTMQSDIQSNLSDIQSNLSDIQSNQSDIQSNQCDVQSNQSDVQSNQSDICNIFITGSCVKLLYYPRCLENKVVVLSKPSQPVLLCHRAILLLVCFISATRMGSSTCTKTHEKSSEVLIFSV